MVVWNTWGVAKAKDQKTEGEDSSSSSENEQEEFPSQGPFSVLPGNWPRKKDDWPLLLLRDPSKELTTANGSEQRDFVRIIPFQRDEEEEQPPPIPIKRSPGRPPKKKPKPKIPVTKSELVWTDESKCHAFMWDNHAYKGDRLVIAYSKTATISASDAQVQLALLKLTDDSEEDAAESTTPVRVTVRPQYARLLKQTSVPLIGSVRNMANVPEVTLQQSAKGTYTLVAGSRGIRMYETASMTLLRVYGENVSLHGKPMVWQSCFVLDNRLQQQLYRQQEQQLDPDGTEEGINDDAAKSTTILRQNRQGFVWIEQENPLAALSDTKDGSSNNSGTMITRRSGSTQRIRSASSVDEQDDEDDDDESHWLHQAWIVGIPHPFRGPKELQETLYFYQGLEKLPLFTLPLPHQSGGVQNIVPLVSSGPSHNNNRNDGMWLRLMVATVHGECMQLEPNIKSSFSGNMYNPGYLVVQDNVEYIEDEDELDKVMVEVRDGKEELEEDLVVAPPLGVKVADDIVDEELQLEEAIRLSLLESQGKSKSSKDGSDDDDDSEDEMVVVRDVFGDDGNDLVIPCEPEPFLRKKLLPEYESDTMMNVNDATDGDISAKDAEFASEILSMLPQSKLAQDRWEKQKTILPPKTLLASEYSQPEAPKTNGINEISAAPSSGKALGRSKRSRAGNLETVMKASIDPELRQFMADRALCWADGSGASLQADAWDHTVSAAQSLRIENDGQAPASAPATSPPSDDGKNGEVLNGNQGSSAALSEASSSGLSAESMNGNAKSAAAAAAAGALSVQIPQTSKSDVEKEIAMELLQLSPRPTATAAPPNTPTALNIGSHVDKGVHFSTEYLRLPDPTSKTKPKLLNGANDDITGGMQVAIIELKDYSGLAQQYSCTGLVEIPLTLEDCGLAAVEAEHDSDEGEDTNTGEVNIAEMAANGDTASSSHKPSSRESSKLDSSDAGGKGNTEGASGSKQEAPQESRCAACQGRMVVHACGKRALPIDFEAIARAEKERKEREEEEKKRMRIEKRKQADAKRREAKKLKKERDKRDKVEKEAELRRMREAKIAEARANMANIGDCIETNGSPQLNGVTEAAGGSLVEDKIELPKVATGVSHATGGADTIHFAIADAWNEHAEKFTAKTESETVKPVVAENGAWPNDGILNNSNAAQSSTLDALASMAEAASPRQIETPSQPPKEPNTTVASAPSTLSDAPAPPGQQQPVQHGFFSSPEASSNSAALIARRNLVLNSYHAMESGGAGAPVARSRVVDLSNQGQAAVNALQQGRAHSFQISPMANASQPQRGLGQQGLPGIQRRVAGAVSASGPPGQSQPYFGYTQLSSHFRPRVNLGSYSASTIFTAYQRQPPPQSAPQPAAPRTESEVPARAPAVAPNRDSYFPGSQPQPAAAVAPRPAPAVAPAPAPGVWMHPSQSLAQARAVPGTILVQPQLGQAPAAGQHMAPPAHIMQAAAAASAQYQHLRGVQQAAGGGAPVAPLSQHVNSVVYKNTTTTTNP